MPRRKPYVPQKVDDVYPEPGIPVAKGWQDMQKLLDEKRPAAKPSGGCTKGILGGIIALLLGVGGYLVVRRVEAPPGVQHTEASRSQPAPETHKKAGGSASGTILEGAQGEKPGRMETHSPSPDVEAPAGEIPGSSVTLLSGVAAGSGKTGKRGQDRNNGERDEVLPEVTPVRPRAAGSETGSGKKEKGRNPGAGAGGSAWEPGSENQAGTAFLNVEKEVKPAVSFRFPTPVAPPVADASGRKQSSGKRDKFELEAEWGLPLPDTDLDTYRNALTRDGQGRALLIPTLGIRKVFGPHQLALRVNPYFNYLARDTPLLQVSGPADSSGTRKVYEEIRLRNMLNSSFGLAYGYRFLERWEAGAAIDYYVHWKARVVKYHLLSTSDSLFFIGRADPRWENIRPGSLVGRLELSYRPARTLRLGVAFMAPLQSLGTPLSAKPSSTRLFLRWRIK